MSDDPQQPATDAPGPITAHLMRNQSVYGGVSLAMALAGLTVSSLNHWAHLNISAQDAIYIQAVWTAIGVRFFPRVANPDE